MVRGRTIDHSVPVTRSLAVQRQYRARKAAQLRELQEQVTTLTAENAALNTKVADLERQIARQESWSRQVGLIPGSHLDEIERARGEMVLALRRIDVVLSGKAGGSAAGGTGGGTVGAGVGGAVGAVAGSSSSYWPTNTSPHAYQDPRVRSELDHPPSSRRASRAVSHDLDPVSYHPASPRLYPDSSRLPRGELEMERPSFRSATSYHDSRAVRAEPDVPVYYSSHRGSSWPLEPRPSWSPWPYDMRHGPHPPVHGSSVPQPLTSTSPSWTLDPRPSSSSWRSEPTSDPALSSSRAMPFSTPESRHHPALSGSSSQSTT